MPFPPPEDLPDPGIELESSALAGVTPEPQDVNEPGFYELGEHCGQKVKTDLPLESDFSLCRV